MNEHEHQQKLKNARTSGEYDQIWQNTGKCVLCDLKDKYILHEENGIVLTINIYPYIDGQMMVVPRKHISSPKELSQVEWETMRKFSYLGKKMIKKVHGLKGMWTLIREGGVNAQMSITEHLHMQLIPFDKKDLSVWNFRDLKYTPLENVELYVDESKEFVRDYLKFEEKYSNKTMLPVVCDLIIINNKKEILLQERKAKYKFNPDIYTFPGGHIHTEKMSITESLAKEVLEEVNYKIGSEELTLLDSRISQLNEVHSFKKFKYKIKHPHVFVRNTYLLKSFDKKQKLIPGDDCEKIIWLSFDGALKNPKVNVENRELIKKAFSQL